MQMIDQFRQPLSFGHKAQVGLTTEQNTTHSTLKQHDRLKGTSCAQGYLSLLTKAKTAYEDAMRIASLASNQSATIAGRKLPSPRLLAETKAKSDRVKAEAAALVWAADCMRGVASGPGPTEGTVSSAASGSGILDQVVKGIPSMSQGVLPAQVMSAVAQPIIGQSALDRQQMMAQQEAMDLALAAEAQAADKKKKMLMYGAAGLGVVALAFIFLRRRG